MKPKVFLENYFISKVGQKEFKKITKKNLISEGILDSLDIVTLSLEIKKKFKIDIKFDNEKSVKLFESYGKLLNKIQNEK